MIEPVRGNQGDEASLPQTDRRNVIHLTLTLQRAYWRLWNRDLTVQEVEMYVDGRRSIGDLER